MEKVSDVKEMTFGIKKYEYKMVDNVVGYPVLTFFINGQKIYLKGGNWGNERISASLPGQRI